MDKKMFIVDRIEDESIVLESYDGEIIVVDKRNLESMPKEGDILIEENKSFIISKEETDKRREKIKKMMKGVWVE